MGNSTQKLILLDLDGTLTGFDGIVPASAIAACQEARKNGHLVYLCTGRSIFDISADIKSIGFDGIASSAGARIESGGTVILNVVIPVKLTREIADYLESRQCGFVLEKNHIVLANAHFIEYWKNVKAELSSQPSSTLANYEAIDNLIALGTKHPAPEKFEDSHCEGVSKIVFVDSGFISLADIRKTFAAQCEIFDSSFPYCGKESGEISMNGIDKGTALQKISEYHNIPLEHTIAFGDSNNDHPMLKAAAIGIAMGNASPATKNIADYVTTSLTEDGVYNGFVKYGLI